MKKKHKKLHVFVVYEYGKGKKEARIHGVYFDRESADNKYYRLGLHNYPKPTKGTVLKFSIQGNTSKAVCKWLLETGHIKLVEQTSKSDVYEVL